MKTKTNRILSIMLSLVFVFSCTLPTSSINTSALSDGEKIANLKAAWSDIVIAPDVLLENWYVKDGTWKRSTDVSDGEINGQYFPVFDSADTIGDDGFISMGLASDGVNSTAKPIDIRKYDEIFFYYKLQSGSFNNSIEIVKADAGGKNQGIVFNLSLSAATNWKKCEFKSRLVSSANFNSNTDYLMRAHFKWLSANNTNNNLKVTSVLAVPTFETEFGFDIDNDTESWTLNDWIQKAKKFDFNNYSNGQTVIDLLNEYYYNVEVNFVNAVCVEAYRTNTSGTREAISEDELPVPSRHLLYDNSFDESVKINRNNSTVDIIYCLPNIKKASQLGIHTETQNIQGLKIYTSSVKDAVWNEKSSVYTYPNEQETQASKDIRCTLNEPTMVKYVRFSITKALNNILDITEVYVGGLCSEDVDYNNIFMNSNNSFELSAALKNIESGTVTDAKTDDNRYGSNQNKLKIENITDGVDDTVYDFMIGYANDTSFNLIIDLKQAYTIDRISLKSGSDENYYPTNMKFYVGSTKESVTEDNPTPVKTYTAKTVDGIYEAEFSPVVGQYICIEIIDNACNDYMDLPFNTIVTKNTKIETINGKDVAVVDYEVDTVDNPNNGKRYLLTVVDEISVYGVETTPLMLTDPYEQYTSEIRAAWGNVRHKPEVLLDTFWTCDNPDYSETNRDWSKRSISYGESKTISVDGVKETVNTYTFTGYAPYLIHFPEETNDSGVLSYPTFRNANTNIQVSDYDELYYYAKNDYTATVPVYVVDTANHLLSNSINVGNNWKKYNIDINKLLAVKDTTGMLGRMQTNTATGLSVSTVMGVKKMDYASEFGQDVSDNLSNNTWSLAQWIVAAAGIDFSQYVGGEYVIDAINKIKKAEPEYAALYDLAAVWKTTNKITGTYSLDTVTGVDITQCSSSTIPAEYNFVAGAKINKYTFIGRGANNTFLLQDGYSASATYKGTFNKNAVVYLSYYVPEEVTRDPYIFTTFEGIGAAAAQTGNKVFLTERGKWSLLTSDDLKGPLYDNITSVSKIECDMDTNNNIDATLYLGPVIFAEDSTINTVEGNTIGDYFDKANELNLDAGNYTNEAAFKEARTALAEALNKKNCKIYGHGVVVWHDDSDNKDKNYYTENGINYTAFRVIAQYTCPNVNGKADLSKIIVNGKTYELHSRGILINKNSTKELNIDNYKDQNAKYIYITGDTLTQKYWSIIDNYNGTSTVQFSIALKKINKSNAEDNTHTSRAVMQYYDDNKEVQTIYSKQIQHVTIHDIWKACGTGDWFPGIDFDNKDNWDIIPFD